MKGKFIHNHVMAAALQAALELKGFQVLLELAVRRGQHPPSIDLACRANGRFLVFEFERTTDRIGKDVLKAEQIGANILTIVVPNAHLRLGVINALKRSGCGPRGELRLQVMTLGSAFQWVANGCPALKSQPAPGRIAPFPTPKTKSSETTLL